MKIIFLDVDGVFNRRGTRERSPNGTYGVEQNLLDHLREIIEKTNARIVVSSAWRHYEDQMEYFWKEAGEKVYERYYGRTPSSFSGYRGKEIQSYLDKFVGEPPVFVIIDDNSDMRPYMDKLIQTNPLTGITEENAKKAIRMLNEES